MRFSTEAGAELTRRLEAEGRDAGRQGQVVVDGLRDVGDAQVIPRRRGTPTLRAEKQVSSPPMARSR